MDVEQLLLQSGNATLTAATVQTCNPQLSTVIIIINVIIVIIIIIIINIIITKLLEFPPTGWFWSGSDVRLGSRNGKVKTENKTENLKLKTNQTKLKVDSRNNKVKTKNKTENLKLKTDQTKLKVGSRNGKVKTENLKIRSDCQPKYGGFFGKSLKGSLHLSVEGNVW